jgi:uncharacterized membrane protein
MDATALIFRWIHIAAVIVAVGGAFFLRLIVHPALLQLGEDQRAAFRATLIGRWKHAVHLCVVLILGSGAYNFFAVTRPLHRGQMDYLLLVAVKVVLALGMFFIAEALVGRAAAFEPMRRKAPSWLLIYLLAAALIVGISGYLRLIPPA